MVWRRNHRGSNQQPPSRRQPLKKLRANEESLLKLLERWRAEAEKAGHKIKRITGRLRGRPGRLLTGPLAESAGCRGPCRSCSVAVSRQHRRAKTDRLDTEQLERAFSAGSAASGCTARWARSRPSQRKMPSALTERETLVGEHTHHYHQPHQGDPATA